MNFNDFIDKSKELVVDFTNKQLKLTGNTKTIGTDDVYVVWSCKTLQNGKALLGTDVPDGMYFESTLNGDKDELYFDAYSKVLNKRVEV